MYIKRLLQLDPLLEKKSFFLFGSRSTGKTSIIRHQLTDIVFIDLLRGELYLRLSAKPWLLEEIILSELVDSPTKSAKKIIVIDEIQKIPSLLDEVHRLIEMYSWTFLLTGSSARKLRQKGVNLLAGRAWEARLLPLTFSEIPSFDLEKYVRYGGLPVVYLSSDPLEELYAYVDTYLKEEIQAESFVRKMVSFSRFLEIAALSNGQMLNFSTISNQSDIPISTVREYFFLLEDTLLGFTVDAWKKSIKRKAISRSKFYFFDIGISHVLAGIHTIDSKSDLFGRAFEHFIALELYAYLSYRRCRLTLSYWRSVNGQEVDFVIGDQLAIEVKSSMRSSKKQLKGLLALKEEGIIQQFYLVSRDKINRQEQSISMMYWEQFLTLLWSDQLISV